MCTSIDSGCLEDGAGVLQLEVSENTTGQEIVDMVGKRWDLPYIDAFATRFTNKLSMFISPVLDEMAYGVDSLSLEEDVEKTTGRDVHWDPSVYNSSVWRLSSQRTKVEVRQQQR